MILKWKNGHKDMVSMLIDRGAGAHKFDSDGETPLFKAAEVI